MNKKKEKTTTGMWIPGEVCFNPDLTATDQRVFWLVRSFDRDENHCYLSNNEMAELLHVSEQTISNSISTLVDQCYIEQREFIGQIRVLVINSQFEDLYKDIVHDFYLAYKKIYNRATVRYKKIYSEQVNKFIPENIKDININNINISNFPKGKLDATPQNGVCIAPFQDYSVDTQNLFNFWNSLGKPLSKHKPVPSVLFNNAMTRLQKKLDAGYKVEEISQAMVLYHMMLDNPQNYMLNKWVPGHLVGLDCFFKANPFVKEKIDQRNIAYNVTSWFDECIKGLSYLDKTYGRYITDQYPVITNKFKQLWEESEFNTSELTVKDENCFRKASIELMNFVEAKKHCIQFSRVELERMQTIVGYVFDAIRADDNGSISITTAWLCSKSTYEKRLPRYFVENGMM